MKRLPFRRFLWTTVVLFVFTLGVPELTPAVAASEASRGTNVTAAPKTAPTAAKPGNATNVLTTRTAGGTNVPGVASVRPKSTDTSWIGKFRAFQQHRAFY